MKRSIETRSLPNLLVATLATLPSMSLIPSAPFPICGNRRQCARCNREKILRRRSSLRSRFGGVGGYGGTNVVVQAPTALKSGGQTALLFRPCITEESIQIQG